MIQASTPLNATFSRRQDPANIESGLEFCLKGIIAMCRVPSFILLLTSNGRLRQKDFIFFFITAHFFALLGQTQGADAIRSAFDAKSGAWQIAWPGRVAQYDLVYQSPPIDPMQGIALGNGDVGVLFWCEDTKIIAAVSKCDLWDDAPFDRFHNWKREEEDHSTTLRHACRIIFDFGYPIFNTLYLTDFNGRLSLADASMQFTAASPFGCVRFEAFVDHASGMLLCQINSNFNEDTPVDIAIERYGSRTYSHWYSQINGDARIGLDGTSAGVQDKIIFVEQILSSGRFACGGAVWRHNDLQVFCAREHARRSSLSLTGAKNKQADLAFAFTSPMAENPLASLSRALALPQPNRLSLMRASHDQAWQKKWLRSFMDYGDEYLNSLWHLTMYYALASQGGRYPGRFTNGLWGWSRDVQPWNFYFHWNQQQLYWPLNAAGHHDLVNPYLDYRFNSLPMAQQDAAVLFKAAGAFVSDVTDRRGYNSLAELSNHTPVAEIALDFWRQYNYTKDKTFLHRQVLPYMIEASRFLSTRLAKEPDGRYHAVEGTGYEGWIKLRDGLTELVYVRALLQATLAALLEADQQIPEMKGWQEIIEGCAPLPMIQAGVTVISRSGPAYQLRRGFFNGRPAVTNEIFAAGWGIEEKRWLSVFFPPDSIGDGLKLLDGIFPSVPSCPVFPSGLIGLAQKGGRLFDAMATTIRLYSPEVTGWDPVAIVLARLGLAEELDQDLQRFPQRWQIYVNGWGHWGLEGEVNKDAEMFFRANQVKVIDSTNRSSSEKIPLPMWPFRHMSMESMSVLATAMNESALQSYDGILRIAPALTKDKNGRFTLHAQGGFIVSFEISSGAVAWIHLESLFGSTCRMQLPWQKATAYSTIQQKKRLRGDKPATIPTQPGERITLLPEGVAWPAWTVVPESAEKNTKVRRHASGKAQLGLEKRF